jgi:hypothetical protein
MGIDRKQPGALIRTPAIIISCVALVAMTTGLLLTLHLGDHDHQEKHDSHHCSVCQQLLVLAKQFMVEPTAAIPNAAQARRISAPLTAIRPLSHLPEATRPRGPPSARPLSSS